MRGWIAAFVVCAACGAAEPREGVRLEVSAPAVSEAAASERVADDVTGYNACHSRHYRECEGPRPMCMFSPARHDDRWSVCSQRCEQDADCHAAPSGGTAPVRCKPIIEHPPPPGACVLDCADGQTCPDGMVCATWLGICAHTDAAAAAI